MRCLVKRNAQALAVLEASAQLGGEIEPVIAPDVVAALASHIPAPDVASAIADLLSCALVFGDEQSFQIAPEVMNALPAGFRLIPENKLPHDAIVAAVADLTAGQRKILETLLDSGGVGLSKDAAPDADPSRPIPMMIAAGLLHRVDGRTVRLPQEVRYALTGTTPPLLPLRLPEGVEKLQQVPARIDNSSAASGLEIVRLLRRLCEYLWRSPLPLLRDGALGVRALQTLTQAVGCDEATTLRLIALAGAAGLIDRGMPASLYVDNLAATATVAEFLAADLATQWAIVATAWWEHANFATWLVVKPVRALAPETFIEQLPQTRQLLLQHCTSAGTFDDIRARTGFYFPLRAARISESLCQHIVDEAIWLGMLIPDGDQLVPSSVLGALIAGEDPKAVTAQLTPAPVRTLIPQGDMTVLAPGPLEPDVYHEVSLLADLESPGLASVYRLSEHSIRRGFDAGRTADDIKEFLRRHIIGDLPQTIDFLIDDIARRHGQLRGGVALCYLRCADEALMLEISRTNAAADVALQIIAPTAAVAQAPLAQVIASLRAEGFHPVAEDATGMRIDMRPPTIELPAPESKTQHRDDVTPAHIADALSAIRRGDAAATAAEQGTKTGSHGGGAVGVLQSAIRANRPVTVGFVDKHGTASHLYVTPIAVTGGQVSAIDETTGQLHTFSVHRITEVRLADSGVQ